MDPCYRKIGGLALRDRWFSVPLHHAAPDGERLSLYAREVVAAGRERDALPVLVFLQGGPGHAAPRPLTRSGWIGRAVEEYRVLLLDQRGTGRSTPVTAETLALRGGRDAALRWLKAHRADSIVQDCECIRREWLGADTPWSVLGQSFGGFCATHYLSAAPEGLREVLITGGLPSLEASAADVYRRTYRHVERKNERFFARYPEDRERLTALLRHLEGTEVRLPSGDRLDPRRFLQLGLCLGMSDGAETLHYLLEDAFHGAREVASAPLGLSRAFLRSFENLLGYDVNPLFSLLQEACYAQGAATRWAAHRVRAEFPRSADPRPEAALFTGEMMFPWMFDEIAALRPFREVAHALAEADDWPALYDAARLERNTVPVVAAVYANDMYVDREFSERTAERIGAKVWLTDEFEHNGIRADGARVLGRLLDLLHDRV